VEGRYHIVAGISSSPSPCLEPVLDPPRPLKHEADVWLVWERALPANGVEAYAGVNASQIAGKARSYSLLIGCQPLGMS